MLLYVDKKKEKLRKIKIFFSAFFILLVIILNVFHFQSQIDTTDKSLTKYTDIKHSNKWFDNTDSITIFKSNKNTANLVILTPKIFNKEIAQEFAYVFSQLPQKKCNLEITPEISHPEIIQKIVNSTADYQSDNICNVLITSNIEDAISFAKQNKLMPYAISYTSSKKTEIDDKINNIINDAFPPKKILKSKLDIELNHLKKLKKAQQESIIKLIQQKEIPFSKQDILLQNIRLCIKTNKNTYWQTNGHFSFRKNISLALQNISAEEHLEKLILLTSEQEILDINNYKISKENGIHFVFKEKELCMLYNDLFHKNIPQTIRKVAGMNPEYSTPEMKFYEFKTLEINLDDNI